MYAFVLIIMLILLSGMVAYIGDQLGMKIGKKRISIFGLRPRYSSIIITVVTGMVIATLSVVILLSVYSGLRQALFNINEVMERLDQLDTELERRTAEVERMEEQRDELQGRVEALRDERDDLQALVDDLSGERYELENRIEELNEELAEVSEDLDEARDQLAYFRDEDIVFRRGEIIYSAVIEGGRSEDEIIADINDFLAKANSAAAERPIDRDDETGMALHLQTEDILHAAQLLYNLEPGERMIISLAARVNVPRHDKLRADLHLNRNFVVYDEGESIADRTIDANSSTSEIDDELRELLAEVNYHASQEGILQNIDGTVGSLDFVNFYQLVSDIQDYEGEVSVSVEASEEIWRSDRLSDNITFSIEDASGDEEAARLEFSGDEEDA